MFGLNIKTDNDAFADLAGEECARILRDVAKKLDEGYTDGPLVDFNGTKVGWFHLNTGD